MARKNFSLKDIQLLADHYSRSGDPEAVALFQTIQSFYGPGQNPEGRAPIDPLEILIALENSPVSLKAKEILDTFDPSLASNNSAFSILFNISKLSILKPLELHETWFIIL